MSYFGSHPINKDPLRSLFCATVFAFLCFVLVTSWFWMVPGYRAQVLSGVPEPRMAMTSLMDKICVLWKLCSDMSSGVLALSSVLKIHTI